MPPGVVVDNTGSYGRPFAPLMAEVGASQLRIRKVSSARGLFRPGPTVEEFPLS
jgi:hypothetical protein